MSEDIETTWGALRFLAELMRTGEERSVAEIVDHEFLDGLADEVERLTPPWMYLSVMLPADVVEEFRDGRVSGVNREILVRACEASWSGIES